MQYSYVLLNVCSTTRITSNNTFIESIRTFVPFEILHIEKNGSSKTFNQAHYSIIFISMHTVTPITRILYFEALDSLKDNLISSDTPVESHFLIKHKDQSWKFFDHKDSL